MPWNLLALWTEVMMFPRKERGEKGAWVVAGVSEVRRVSRLTASSITVSRALIKHHDKHTNNQHDLLNMLSSSDAEVCEKDVIRSS